MPRQRGKRAPIERIPVAPDIERGIGEASRQLRRAQTPAERALWRALRAGQLAGAKFRRQQPIGPFVADFFDAQHRLIVELDGAVHRNQVGADLERQALLETAGYRVVRFTNEQIHGCLPEVLDAIAQKLNEPRSPSPLEGEGARG